MRDYTKETKYKKNECNLNEAKQENYKMKDGEKAFRTL